MVAQVLNMDKNEKIQLNAKLSVLEEISEVIDIIEEDLVIDYEEGNLTETEFNLRMQTVDELKSVINQKSYEIQIILETYV